MLSLLKSPNILKSLALRKGTNHSKDTDLDEYNYRKSNEISNDYADDMAKNVELMDTIITYLDGNNSSPLYLSPLEVRTLNIERYLAGLPEFDTPAPASLPQYTEHHEHLPRRSIQSTGSLLSNSWSYEEPAGPKTPNQEYGAVLPRSLTKDDVGLAAKPLSAVDATPKINAVGRADPKIRRAFSFELVSAEPELVPEPPSRSAPTTPRSDLTKGDQQTRAIVSKNYGGGNKEEPYRTPSLEMQTRITTFADYFMPVFVPSPEISPQGIPTKKSPRHSLPELRIDTKDFGTPVNQSDSKDHPELESSPPILPVLHVKDMISPRYTQQLQPASRRSPASEQSPRVVTSWDSRNRQSFAAQPPAKTFSYEECRSGATRYSLQEQVTIKRPLVIVPEEGLYAVKKTQLLPYPVTEGEQAPKSRPVSEYPQRHISFEVQEPMVIPRRPVSHHPVPSILQIGKPAPKRTKSEQVVIENIPASGSSTISAISSISTKPRRSREEIEAIPIPIPALLKILTPTELSLKDPHVRRTQSEIESIPIPIPLTTSPTSPTSSTTSSSSSPPQIIDTNHGTYFINPASLFTSAQGLTLKLTRFATSFSRLEYQITSLSNSPTPPIKCFASPHSLSRRKDFCDLKGHPLFTFQKKVGSTRIAESHDGKGGKGRELFSVQDAGLAEIPYWRINFSAASGDDGMQWVAKGDEGLKGVVVMCGGFEVGRIGVEEGGRKHSVRDSNLVSLLTRYETD